MANINLQGDFNGLLEALENRYEDTVNVNDSTSVGAGGQSVFTLSNARYVLSTIRVVGSVAGEIATFTVAGTTLTLPAAVAGQTIEITYKAYLPTTLTTANVDIIQPRDTVLTTGSLGNNLANNFAATPNQIASFTADNCFINFTDNAAAGGSSTENWLGGTLNITNSTLNYTGGGGAGFVWPGFGAAGGNNVNTGQPVAERSTFNFENTRIVGDFTLQFQGGNVGGRGATENESEPHNLTNLDISAGPAPFFLFGMADLVGVAFSGSTGLSGTVPNAPPAGGPVYMRMDNPVGAGGPAAVLPQQWWGLFGCDFRNWTNTGANDVYINQITQTGHFSNIGGAGQPALPTIFIVDGQLSAEIIAQGFRLGSTGGAMNFVTGISFNPRLRDSATLTPTTDAVFINFNTADIWLAQEERNFNILPTREAGVGVRQINGATDFGFVLETDTNNSQAAIGTVNAPAAVPAMNYWVYGLQNYDPTTRAVRTITPEARAWTNSMQFADFQDVDIMAESLLNGNSKGQAENFATGGINAFGNAYAVGKSLAVDGRLTSFALAGSTANRFTVNGNLSFGGTSAITANSFNVELSGTTLDLNGMTLAPTGTLSTSSTVIINDGTLAPGMSSNIDELTFGPGITLDGTFTNVPITDFTSTAVIDNTGTITSASTLTFEAVLGVVDLTRSVIDGAFIPTQNLIVTAAQANQFFNLRAAGTRNNPTLHPPGDYTFNGQTITIPAQSFTVMPEIVAGVGGLFALRDIGANDTVVFGNWDDTGNLAFVTGNANNLSIQTTDTRNLRFYVKANSTLGGQVYRTTSMDVSGSTLTRDLLVPPISVNQFFTENATALDANTAVTFQSATVSDADLEGRWSDATATNTGVTAVNTQAAVINAANDLVYFTWTVNNNHTIDHIDYLRDSVLVNSSVPNLTTAAGEGIRFTSNNENNQTSLRNLTGFLTQSVGVRQNFETAGGVPQVISQDDNEASIPTVVAAVTQILVEAEEAVQSMINQQSDAIQGATVPGKGVLGRPARVDRNTADPTI